MLRREPFLCKLIFFLFCFASLSLADELTDSDRLEFTANASISNTSLPKPKEGGSFADMIDKALEKEFTENDQNEATDAGSFNNSVAEQQVGFFFFCSQILNDSRFDSVGAFSFGCKMNLFTIIISD
ncbi:hypothetical protein NC651_020083 [Populus alba x Populus x berolinensis]|nr:hypothetical protein NC651_021879 [Populus alba x Populus x berolinensis]KAJ6902501.1 hypothetical protein NC651_020083 [Populus alba x Populus x berolinensis]